jgi:hypothetical protein
MKIETALVVLKKLPYFTKQNLSLALNIKEESLNYWIKKLIKQKTIIPIKKGLYISSYYRDVINQNTQNKENYFEYLANIIRYPSYISLEYVMAKDGFIPESTTTITSVTTKSSRKYLSGIGTYTYQSIKNNLFFGYITIKFMDKEIKIASLSKAIFDFLYLQPFESEQQMALYLKEEGRFNWGVLSNNDKKTLIKTCVDSNSKKMLRVIKILKQEKIL